MKVAYFDYWTRGINHFVPVDKVLKQQGEQTLLIHLGSMREAGKAEDTINGILCRDYTYYGTKYIYEILEKEQPDVVLTLNARTIFDRALVVACRKLGIATVYMAHGIDPYIDDLPSAVKGFEKSINNVKFLAPRVGKYLNFIIPNYLNSVWRAGLGVGGVLRALRTVIKYALNPGKAVQLPPDPEELTHDRHLVFSNRAVRYVTELGFPKDRCHAIGNPKYDDLLKRKGHFKASDLPAGVQELLKQNKPYVLVLEEALPEAGGLGGWNSEYRNGYLKEIGKAAKAMNCAMVVKLHPGTKIEEIQLSADDGLVFQKADLDALIHFASFCVCHNSTTIDNCVLLDKVVLQPRWGLSMNLADYFGPLKVTNYWISPMAKPDLTINKAARDEYKLDRITVLEPKAAENAAYHLREAAGPDAPHEHEFSPQAAAT